MELTAMLVCLMVVIDGRIKFGRIILMSLEHLVFVPPGPGLWETDGLHSLRPLSQMCLVNRFATPLGMRIGFSRYGQLVDGIQLTTIHRFSFAMMRMIVSRPPGSPSDAKEKFGAQVKANPEIQERFVRAEDALTRKRWREDSKHWWETGRPWVMGRTLELTDLDPSAMDDEGLLQHVSDTLHHLGRSMEHHHILNPVAATPGGLLLLNAHDWTGLSALELEPLMVGSSPISAGDEPELRALAKVLQSDGNAASLIESDDDAALRIENLTALEGPVGKAARQFVRMVGYRTIMSWEPMDPYILEQPELLTAKIRHALEGSYATVNQDFIALVRDKVPGIHRDEFDDLLEDARKYSCIRDERDIYCNMPVSGLVRRAVLETGRRIFKKGLVDELEHVTEASPTELRALLRGTAGPSATELGDRHNYRKQHTINDVPDSLGEQDQVPVDPDWLPPASRVFARIRQVMQIGELETESKVTEIRGQKASGGCYEGIARVIHNAEELSRLQQGDILVTLSTNPAFNVVLPKLGAIVTAFGGVLSHAAIVAREFGLPAVVGCKHVTDKIQDGARVRVDGDTGVVTVLS